MALDNGYHFAAQALPTPTDKPYEMPSRNVSRQPSWQGSTSPFSNYSPAPFPPGEGSYLPKERGAVDTGEDERYDARDPRRLTPNLGISFVSQIHSLKKELESQDLAVGYLEESLYQNKAEKERLHEELSAQKMEVKNVTNQMTSLEHDMLQALENIAVERDKALESVADSRKRLEASQNKVRVQEEDVNRTLQLWEKDKDEWEGNRRKLEGKVHVVEERLKTMVAEMIAVHDSDRNHPGSYGDEAEGTRGPEFVKGHDIRRGAGSRLSNRSIDETGDVRDVTTFRASRMSGLHEMGGSNISGMSLADELSMRGDEDEEDEADDHDVHSPDALPEEVHMVLRRYSEDKKARKLMGLHGDNDEQPYGEKNPRQRSVGMTEDYINLPTKGFSASYTDTATQFTPPSTPALQCRPRELLSEKLIEQTEHSANQSRKRVAIPSIFVEQTSPKLDGPKASSMVSNSCQTDDLLGSGTSLLADVVSREWSLPVTATANEMRSTATQTIENIAIGSKSASTRPSPALDVPVIAIHPPASRPPSSHNSVVLPPRTRNAGCQVAIDMPRFSISTSMQTEDIRVDKRPFRIPPRLQPTALPGKASSRPIERRTRTARPLALETRRNVRSPPPYLLEQTQAPPANVPRQNHGNPSTHEAVEQRAKPSLPHIKSNRPEDLDKEQLDSKPTGNLDDFSDDDDFASAAPIRKTLSKVQNSWRLVSQPENSGCNKLDLTSDEAEDQRVTETAKISDSKTRGTVQPTSKSFQIKTVHGYHKTPSTIKPTDIRRQTLVSNGIAEHAQRARSPSVPSSTGKEAGTVAPPFPVPTRSSSRKIPVSVSEGAASPTPYSTSFFTTRRGQQYGKPLAKRKILRKVQSAAAVSEPNGPHRPHPNPSVSASSVVPGSLKLKPLQQNQFIIPCDNVPKMPHRVTGMPHSRPHAGEASIETPNQQTSVVDAIAQTMVGEWMWKYVRKRTSFGITESPQAEFEMGRNGETGNSSGVRHKRWVWLAPYENAVIWSSKQPTSGPALLGKGGRKLMIQSVLDVKDDTPLPKNAGSQSAFDRSILILTPQRALKFTAVSRERHYIWLTALSFLSHSTRAMDELASPPPVPQEEYQTPLSKEPNISFRRTPVRDSIRVAKARSRPVLGGHSFSSPIAELEHKMVHNRKLSYEDGEIDSEDAAEPPQIPRVAAHARKRSSTGPRPVPLGAFHSYPSNSTAMSSSFSLQSPTSRDKYDRFSPGPIGAKGSISNTSHASMSRCVTDVTRDSYIEPPAVVPDNFFDPVGTMRMEAFVMERHENVLPGLKKAEPPKAKIESRSYRTRQGRKKDMSYWGASDPSANCGVDSPRVREEDLFTGF